MFPPQLTRRRLLQVGGGLFGLSLPRLLHSQAVAGDARPASAKSCIMIVVSGGLSHLDTFDPKPKAPTEVRGPYKTIPTSVPGLHFTEMLPQLAAVADRCAVLRSQSHDDTVHVTAAHTMLSGQSDGRRRNNSPLIGSLISMLRPATVNMPSHVWLHNMKTGTNKIPRYDNGLNLIGRQHAALRIGHELDNPSSDDFRVRAFDPADDVTVQRLSDRAAMLERMQTMAVGSADGASPERFRDYQQRASDLIAGRSAQRAFELHHESESVRDRFGRHPLGQYLLMARRLIEAGVRIVTVTAWPGLAPGETQPTVTQVWDTHDVRYKAGDSMFGNGPFGMKSSLPRLDQSVSALLFDLEQRGLLQETLVALVTEFGRTPKFEGNGRGRGHWPHCYSGLLAGGGVQGGAVYGASDQQGAYVAAGRSLTHLDFGATLYQALGIPPETRYGPDDFSFRVSEGMPLTDVF